MTSTDFDFWIAFRAALLAIVAAIERYKLERKSKEEEDAQS